MKTLGDKLFEFTEVARWGLSNASKLEKGIYASAAIFSLPVMLGGVVAGSAPVAIAASFAAAATLVVAPTRSILRGNHYRTDDTDVIGFDETQLARDRGEITAEQYEAIQAIQAMEALKTEPDITVAKTTLEEDAAADALARLDAILNTRQTPPRP